MDKSIAVRYYVQWKQGKRWLREPGDYYYANFLEARAAAYAFETVMRGNGSPVKTRVIEETTTLQVVGD